VDSRSLGHLRLADLSLDQQLELGTVQPPDSSPATSRGGAAGDWRFAEAGCSGAGGQEEEEVEEAEEDAREN
jgi:hypothetical protein